MGLIPINKQEKYDRQLRLWASSGQTRLEHSSVLVCQPTITSLELLKNLVLPGIGHFTILDTARSVSERDLAANFYLRDDDIGKDWTETVVKNLGELNEDVESEVIHVKDMDDWWVEVTQDFWANYDLVIMPYEYQRALRDLYELNIPTIVINTVGFYGYMRVVTQEFEVVETHPETLLDLRVLNPWPELKEYVDGIKMEGMSVETQSQVPYLVIQMKALDHWKSDHGGAIPKTSAEKEEFKKLIQSWRMEYGQANFDEAIDNARKMFIQTKVRSNVEDIFNKLPQKFFEANKITPFWLLVKALKQFVDKNDGFLPLKGELPDMDSSTDQYIGLQNIYRSKAESDLESFKSELQSVLTSLDTAQEFTETEIRTFVKNANHLFFSTNTSIALNDTNFSQVISGYMSDAAVVLLAYLLIESHILEHHTFPHLSSLDVLLDKSHQYFLMEDTHKLANVLYEMLRSEGVELGNTTALMGGIGGQEAIKLITKQYIPLDNVLVFDGLRSVTEKWKIE